MDCGLKTLELRSWSGLFSPALFLPHIRPHIDTWRWPARSHHHTVPPLPLPEYRACSEARGPLCEARASLYEGFGVNRLDGDGVQLHLSMPQMSFTSVQQHTLIHLPASKMTDAVSQRER